MVPQESLVKAIIKRTLRVPRVGNAVSDGKSPEISRQLDVALISAGFKGSAELLNYVASLHPIYATELSREVLDAAREIKGDHVKHNTYFKDFPENVPDTIEFWTGLIQDTFGPFGFLWDGNLLALDGYGEYQHTYEDMVAAHEPFVASAKEKLTVLHLGASIVEETHKLYISLAESKVAANGDDLKLLKRLAEVCATDPQPEKIPVRENRATINSVRVGMGKAILADTVTDILRLAVELSGGDVSLQEKTKFRSFTNAERRVLLESLDTVVGKSRGKLGDVFKHREQFKRLDERLHSGAYKKYPAAQEVFSTAREAKNLSFESQLEKAFKSNDNTAVLALLEKAPGLFVKSFNRVLLQTNIGGLDKVVKTLETVLPKVSTPTIIGLRQYLMNRTDSKTNRLFINRKGTGRVVKDEQPVLGDMVVRAVSNVLDAEVRNRLAPGVYVVDRAMLGVALPLSNRQTNGGFGIMPRGSTDNLEAEVIRFFNYWKEKGNRTDYDLSAILLDENFNQIGQLSYTNLREVGAVHSGDITSARNGATEFIDFDTASVKAKYIVPQVNIYAGESFDEVEESFFGYMKRSKAEKGKPFEPQTVKSKADMRGKNKVALPLLFIRQDNGSFTVKWVNAFLKGQSWGNATENNRLTTATMIRSVVENQYITVNYLLELLREKEGTNVYFEDEISHEELMDKLPDDDDSKVYHYWSNELPEGLRPDVKTVTLLNLHELL